MTFGATPADWGHFSAVLGLTEDLLPVVSNPNAVISPDSKMAAVGKTPSRYNGRHQAVGFSDWTRYAATSSDIHSWGKQPDYGICLQTRLVRALDIDVDDDNLSRAIAAAFVGCTPEAVLPTRSRSNSGKQLLAFTLRGEFYKRKFKTASGIVEFLATGQQFIAIGQHTSGVRYEWLGGLPSDIPEITPEQFEHAWATIVSEFGIEGATVASAPSKATKLLDLHTNDPVSQRLHDRGMVLGVTREGRLDITCPFEAEHTGPSSESSTSYYPPNTGGFARGHFKCLHAHCEGRHDQDFEEALGFSIGDDFEDLTGKVELVGIEQKPDDMRFRAIQAADFTNTSPPKWIIRGVLPQAQIAVMFGESQSGKTFAALDIGASVALGQMWRNHKTKKLRVVYIAAEGAQGCKNRLKAYATRNDIKLEDLDIYVIPAAPSMLDKKDVTDLIASLLLAGPVGLIIVDTWAQVTAGGNENSGEDMGRALKNCHAIHKATGAMILLVHHSGKNAAAGARGWSGLRGAADAEFEVLRADEDRVMTVTKQKDGEDGAQYGFRLERIAIGVDEEGDEMTSCVVEYTDTTKKTIADQPTMGEAEVLDLANGIKLQIGEDPWLNDVRVKVKADMPEISRSFNKIIASLTAKGLVLVDDMERLELLAPPNLI